MRTFFHCGLGNSATFRGVCQERVVDWSFRGDLRGFLLDCVAFRREIREFPYIFLIWRGFRGNRRQLRALEGFYGEFVL